MLSLLQFAGYAMSALALGAIIGIERQHRNSPAGLRTNTLVAVGAALFVLVETLAGAQDSRIAAQIVSGIGFIGGGAILREGLTIRGVNTAATLWCSAAVGTLCGTGYIREAAAATAIILFANIGLRPLSYRIGTLGKLRIDVETRYTFTFTCPTGQEVALRQALVQAANASSLIVQAIRAETPEGSMLVKVTSLLVSPTKSDAQLESMVERLSGNAGIRSIEWQVSAQPGLQHE